MLMTVAKATGQIDISKCGCFTSTGKGGGAYEFSLRYGYLGHRCYCGDYLWEQKFKKMTALLTTKRSFRRNA